MKNKNVTENIATRRSPALQIGIINLMPNPAVYHQELLRALAPLQGAAQLHWICLESKDYAEEDAAFLSEGYETFNALHKRVKLDAIILSGAPVELLEFSAVDYWQELEQILQQVISEQLSSLGICWGGLAIGKVLGIDKESLAQKVFGVFSNQPGSGFTSGDKAVPEFMPFSIQARFKDEQVAANIENGTVSVVAHARGVQHSILTSSCGRHLMCLGHPEYGPNRLVDEWHRDLQKIPSMPKPDGINVQAPEEFWRPESSQFFSHWLEQIQQRQRLGRIATPQQPDNNKIPSDKDMEESLT